MIEYSLRTFHCPNRCPDVWLRARDDSVLDGTFLWWEVGHADLDIVLVQLLLELGIINIPFQDHIAGFLVDRADTMSRPSKNGSVESDCESVNHQ